MSHAEKLGLIKSKQPRNLILQRQNLFEFRQKKNTL